jgi:ketosteroid isomerase-like protein
VDSTGVSGSADEVIAAWRAASERGDALAAAACLAPDVTVISPLTAQFRFHGRDQALEMLSAAFEVITGIRFHTEVGDATTRALFYHAHAGKQALEEAQLLRLDAAGQIAELTLFGRPLPGLTAVMAEIGPRLLRRQNRPALARVVTLATAPLAAMTRLGERRLLPLADPARPSRRG